MQRRSFLSLATLSIAFVAITGCATGSAVSTGESMNVQIQIDNNLPGITGVSVYLISDTGGRRSLGPIESNKIGTYDRSIRAGDYQLLATRLGAADIVSERFRVDSNNLAIAWVLAQNQLSFAQR
jgi:hypothetical protein